MIKKSLAIVAAFIFVSNALALESFHNRFKLIRDDSGKLVEIRDASLTFKFSIWPYVNHITETLEREQDRMNQKSNYEAEIEDLLAEEAYLAGDKNSENIERVILSLKSLQGLDLRVMLQDESVKEVLEVFQTKITEVLQAFNPSIIARLDNPSFFYQRNVTYQVLTFALNFAKKKLSHLPVLNTVSFILMESERLINQRRMYHQNMLLHYFERMDEAELKMTASEVDLAYSSIYESRIPWFAVWESKNAKKNWANYGVNKFFQEFRMATNKLRSKGALYTQMGERVNYAFQEVVYKGESVIVNLVDKESMFNSMPAVAYSYDRPNRVLRKRSVLQLGQLGLSFLTINGTIKDMATNFIKSFYENQTLTEGALYAHFDIQNNEFMKKELKKQTVNPFETSL